MIPDDIISTIEGLLALLTGHPDNFRSDNSLLYVDNPTAGLTAALRELQVTVDEDHDTLVFTNFPIPSVFTSQGYENRIQPGNYQQNFVVIDFPNTAVIHFDEELAMVGIGDQALFQAIDNRLSYYQLYNTLKAGNFADHHNDAEKEIIIYNSAKGILKIQYPVPAPRFTRPIQQAVTHLLAALTNELLKIYLKNSLFEFATGNTLQIEEFISKESDIVSAAKRDQELATKQFDFEKFRDSLYNQKDKFFNTVRDLLSKIYSQIIGIPISITASVFAAYKIDHDRLVSVLILVSFLLYVVIYLVTQYTYYKDIQEVKTDFERDFSDIQLKSGLPADVVKLEYTKVADKIGTAKNISLILMFSIVALGICVVFFIANQIIQNK